MNEIELRRLLAKKREFRKLDTGSWLVREWCHYPTAYPNLRTALMYAWARQIDPDPIAGPTTIASAMDYIEREHAQRMARLYE
jgi:hypothetical protein